MSKDTETYKNIETQTEMAHESASAYNATVTKEYKEETELYTINELNTRIDESLKDIKEGNNLVDGEEFFTVMLNHIATR